MGHAFVAHAELVHVPLLLHWPRRIAPASQVTEAVSTRRVYHTILAAAEAAAPISAEIQGDPATLTLLHEIDGRQPEQATAFSEIYPPLNFVKAIERRQPALLTHYRCTSLRRAIVRDGWKLIQVAEQADALFDLAADPLESHNVMQLFSADTHALNTHLDHFTSLVHAQREGLTSGAPVELQDDTLLRQLRGLGYVE